MVARPDPDGFVMADNVDNAYSKVGTILQGGSLGQVASHDDAAHTYTLNVPSAIAQQQKKKGFFSRIFSHDKSDSSSASSGSHQVQITIGSSGTNASEVRAQGNAAAVAKVIDTLKSHLGKKALKRSINHQGCHKKNAALKGGVLVYGW
jgi:hypothetical protein